MLVEKTIAFKAWFRVEEEASFSTAVWLKNSEDLSSQVDQGAFH